MRVFRAGTENMADGLILLMIADGLGACTRDQLMRFGAEAQLINQFHFLLTLGDLTESGLIRETDTPEGRLLVMTPEGRQTLTLFGGDLPEEIRERIRENVPLWRRRFRDERQLPATWSEEDGRYTVTFRALEDGKEVLRVSMEAASRAQAQRFCERWPKAAADVYATLIAKLGEPTDE